MKIDKAIEILGAIRRAVYDYDEAEEVMAVKLGIEALKAIKKARDIPYATPAHYLPGETKD